MSRARSARNRLRRMHTSALRPASSSRFFGSRLSGSPYPGSGPPGHPTCRSRNSVDLQDNRMPTTCTSRRGPIQYKVPRSEDTEQFVPGSTWQLQ
jgi:hypothetical protein